MLINYLSIYFGWNTASFVRNTKAMHLQTTVLLNNNHLFAFFAKVHDSIHTDINTLVSLPRCLISSPAFILLMSRSCSHMITFYQRHIIKKLFLKNRKKYTPPNVTNNTGTCFMYIYMYCNL